mmetsp:Transcript_20555/g.50442  ORF Transcript_20555/g.50442 Transcript_20555/m.50442 type:complete len:243 (+) Transcript_20555:53-781(+)
MDAPQESKDEKHFELRRQYRESALKLSSTCDAYVGWATAQCLLDRIWDDQKVESGVPIGYGCQACGFILHPGYLGTTLRLARGKKKSEVNRTHRRREQRRKRKAAIAKEKQKKASNAPKSIDPLPKTGTNLVILKDDSSVVFDRHHLVITCGRCKSSVRCKGLKRETPNSKSLSAAVTVRNEIQKKEAAPTLTPTSDFVALPPVASKPTNPLIQADQQRKKKKKKKAPPKSNLMNFLNSLND